MSLPNENRVFAAYEHGFPATTDTSIPLVVDARDPFTEIFLMDWNLQRVPHVHGIGTLETAVPPGLYKIRFQTGSTVSDELVDVPEASIGAVRVTAAHPLELATPIPSPLTNSYEADIASFIEQHSRTLSDDFGSGSQVFICVRSWDPPELPEGDEAIQIQFDVELKSAKGHPGRNLSLYSPDRGKTLLDMSDRRYFHREHRIACATVSLDPGHYLLRARTDAIGTFEVPLITCQGWKTFVFVQSRPLPLKGKTVWLADVTQSSIFMLRTENVLNLRAQDIRMSEQAKWALRQARPHFSEKFLRELLQDKWINPISGIVGLHLLLLNESVPWDLYREVLFRLQELIGLHPDVAALSLAPRTDAQLNLASQFHRPSFPFPPMLQASWRLLLQAAQSDLATIPPGSFSEQIIEELPRGTLWLCWRRTRNSQRLPMTAERTSRRRRKNSPANDRKRMLPAHESEEPSLSTESIAKAKETLTVTHDDLQKRLSQFKQIAEEAQAAYQQFSAGQPVRLDAEQIAATYRQLKAAYESVSGAAVELGVTIPEDWGNLVTGYQRMNDDRKITATRKVDRSAASPLSYLVKSWLEQYEQLTPELLKTLSDYSGIPLGLIQRAVKRLDENNR